MTAWSSASRRSRSGQRRGLPPGWPALPRRCHAELAWNPEFLREGFAVRTRSGRTGWSWGSPRLEADAALRAVYAPLLEAGTPYITTDLATAELAKVAANAFLATKISFINAMADVCEAAGADVVTLADALGHDNRIGRQFPVRRARLRRWLPAEGHPGVRGPGRGTGRGRLGAVPQRGRRDQQRAAGGTPSTWPVIWSAGLSLTSNVAVLGAAFKPNTDDVRDSPALNVAAAIRSEGAPGPGP